MRDGSQVLLFDLGRVIVEVTGERDIRQFLKAPVGTDPAGWPAIGVWEDFECGLLTPAEFCERFVAELTLSVTPDRFLSEFEAWTRGLLPGAADVLAALRPRFRLAALSNSNEVHWRRNADLGVPQHFERVFGSHELGIRKPKPEIYEYVLREMEVDPGDVTFFDDQQANVDGAREVGMDAYRVEGIDELRACLRELGFL